MMTPNDKIKIQKFINDNDLITNVCQFEKIYEFLELYPFDTIYYRNYNKKYYLVVEQDKYCSFAKVVIIKFKTKKLKETFFEEYLSF